MTREEIIAGLKAGLTLVMGGAAQQEDRKIIQSLMYEGLVDVNLEDYPYQQYSTYTIRWKK